MLRARRAGASSTEYIVIVVCVAIALLVAVTLFGNKISELFKTSTTSLQTGVPQTGKLGSLDSTGPSLPTTPTNPGTTTPANPGTTTPTNPTGPTNTGPVDPMTLRPEERAGRTFWVPSPTGGTLYVFDQNGNKVAKMTANEVPAKDTGYKAAAFAGQGTLNFCNGTTYQANLTLLGANYEAKGPGASFGGSEREKDLAPGGPAKDGQPSLGVDLFKVGGEVVGAKIEGG